MPRKKDKLPENLREPEPPILISFWQFYYMFGSEPRLAELRCLPGTVEKNNVVWYEVWDVIPLIGNELKFDRHDPHRIPKYVRVQMENENPLGTGLTLEEALSKLAERILEQNARATRQMKKAEEYWTDLMTLDWKRPDFVAFRKMINTRVPPMPEDPPEDYGSTK